MNPKRPLRAVLLAAAVLGAIGAAALAYKSRLDIAFELGRLLRTDASQFAPRPFPLQEDHHLFDIGIVDADGDGFLDVFTSNHNYRQTLWLADGSGGYRDVLSEWGLDQNRDFPHWEQSFAGPLVQEPGLYVYWLGETLTLRAHALRTPVKGTLEMVSVIDVERADGFRVQTRQASVEGSLLPRSIVEFEAAGDGKLELSPKSRGVPTQIELAPDVPLASVFIGRQRSTPASRRFSPFLRDRHGLAWADADGDGRLDVYITRGGVGGTIRTLPPDIRDRIRDELLIQRDGPRFEDRAVALGIEKKDCSGRHASWADIDGDGRLELFVNCQDRGQAGGEFHKQLWRLGPDGRYQDAAAEAGLALPGRELIDYAWLDADADGDLDLVTVEDRGVFLYVNDGGHFTGRRLHRPDFVRGDVDGLKAEVNNYWRFDSKLVVADYDNDGDLDLFIASKRGNVLLENRGNGQFVNVPPAAVGLPQTSLLATWVDYDNDGWMDLHIVPDGLFRQVGARRFQATGLLAARPHLYQAAIVHWYDHDNDGWRDPLIALNENAGLWRWWQKPFRDPNAPHAWAIRAWRTLPQGGHWLQVDVSNGKMAGNSPAVGARVTVHTALGTQVQEVGLNDTSFFSQGHYRLYFGLGPHDRIDALRVRWTDGRTAELDNVPANQRLRIDPPGASDPTRSAT